ncbi:Putative NAD(P)H-dependent FMN-containing oxidoreductase ywqN [Serratia entomophila]|uniref:flavodoxin family protein n=1 Tax=Serratia entomophila TaxID=42906 RepID=UPI00217BC3BE|nr:NAD(P)H-dependent oxidoreductase [Serratia entomophila]CAI0810105.1 Putative NAD(P)H-dependent FMN-containing oxidoreductase ywqN [Serratia entomophila]CAI0868611.1 Putative NAD(P)H-dependent FMN-containing oxidoreductase ywqN [Serratia entomophila]
MNTLHHPKHLAVMVGSPRRDGNSAALAQAIIAGAAEAGTLASLHFLDDYISGFLTDERQTPPPGDRYAELFLEHFLPADGAIFCTPVYWYGMSAQSKAFFDRSFSFYSNAYPQAEQVHQRMRGKRIGLAVASEETYPGAALGIVHQIQEFSRYTHSEFVGLVHGAGNQRGEIAHDPRNPLLAARELGREMFTRPYSDYRMDSPRSTQVWPG